MSESDQHVEALEARFTEIEALLEHEPVNMHDLQGKAESLCKDIEAAPAEISQAMQASLAKMISTLEALAQNMKTEDGKSES